MLLNMALGTIGTILILVGIIIMIEINNSSNPSGYLIYLIGFSLVMVYIDFLEQKAGVSRKHGLIKLITTLLIVLMFFLIFQLN